jgi:cell division inhibitor SepF
MSWFKKLKDSINPGDEDDNTYDDDEFEEDYSLGNDGFDSGMSDISTSGNFIQQNPLYNNPSNYNTYQPPQPQPPASSNQQPPASAPPAVAPVSNSDIYASFEVKFIKPEKYADGKRIADLLMQHKTVVVNFDDTNKEIIRKLLDFMAGTIYTIKGDFKQISEKTFIATPPNAKISAEQLRNADRDAADRDPPY